MDFGQLWFTHKSLLRLQCRAPLRLRVSDDANNVHWTDVEKCMERLASYEKAKVDPGKTDMDASIHFLVTDEACFKLMCYAHMA